LEEDTQNCMRYGVETRGNGRGGRRKQRTEGRGEGGLVHTRTPGCHDVITFDEHSPGAGESHGIVHFGFRLVSPGDIDAAVDEVERAGGKLLRRGEFSPGYPYAYVHDPDGYEVEIWYE
jgi:catechol 2,3-dioxygenase-like lactoylglutathione lyase family enzyme